jgi:AcrR family transcriptional regulator
VADGRVEKGELTRERLIDAGRALFGEHGYEATSIESILEAAGTSRGSLYHHFETKEALFDAVLDRVVAEIAEEAGRAALSVAEPVASLRAGFAAWLERARDPAVHRIALLDAPSVVGWSRWREIDGKYVLGGIRMLMQRIADEGRLPPGDVGLLTNMLLAAVGEAALMIATSKDPKAALETGRTAVNGFIDRLVASPMRRRRKG